MGRCVNATEPINVLDPLLRKGYRFKGVAKHSYDGELLELTAGGLGPEYPVDGAVLIQVTAVAAVVSPAYDCGGRTQDSVVAEFRSQYGW